MPRPCALAFLAAPYLAGLWRLVADQPGIALESALRLSEFVLHSATAARQDVGRVGVEDLGVNVSVVECSCTPCPAPWRCEEDAGPAWVQACEPVIEHVLESECEVVPVFNFVKTIVGATTSFIGHERVLVWPLSTSVWMIYTAQGHFYVEDTSLYEKVVALKGFGDRPPGLESVDIVQFDRPVQRQEFLDLLAAAQLHAGALRGALGLPDWP
ncbi:unnamed protein product, partial [Prorocentrum cordatum]